jgi:FKBP-type peptidyl-prolyl cis-trans isomerase SlyD
MSDRIQDGLVVTFGYVIRTQDDEVLDASTPDEPGTYLHGAGLIAPGLEAAMTGRAVGDNLTVEVGPEDGFGIHDGSAPISVARDRFPDELELVVGMQCTDESESNALWIVEISEDEVVLDANHPLAGQSVIYDVTVLAVRPSTDREREVGEPLHD